MMGIYEGIGAVLGIAIYCGILLVTLIGVVIFWVHKKRAFAFWWVSVVANLFSFLYFLGDSTLVGWLIRVFSMVGWPVVNLFWLGMIVFAPKAKK